MNRMQLRTMYACELTPVDAAAVRRVFAERLRLLMSHHKLTQARLALMMNVTESNILHWRQGKCLPQAMRIVTIARLFGVSVDWLLGLDGKTKK